VANPVAILATPATQQKPASNGPAIPPGLFHCAKSEGSGQ